METMTIYHQRDEATLHAGNCLDILPTIASQSVDAVITDPPYPHIKRDYGTWTTEEWWALVVEGVIPEVRRILKPSGSAVFILQPNSKHVGQMRGWLWEFMAWVCREWNMVQDIWWWNYNAMPTGVCNPRERGLTRPSVKACVWAGAPKCHRSQEAVLWGEAQRSIYRRAVRRASPDLYNNRKTEPSGQGGNLYTFHDAAEERGGVTPYNMLPFTNKGPSTADGSKHGASTPLAVADWWTRYICPPGGTILDMFNGSGTMGVAAIQNDCKFIGIDQVGEYNEIAKRRIDAELAKPRQAALL